MDLLEELLKDPQQWLVVLRSKHLQSINFMVINFIRQLLNCSTISHNTLVNNNDYNSSVLLLSLTSSCIASSLGHSHVFNVTRRKIH